MSTMSDAPRRFRWIAVAILACAGAACRPEPPPADPPTEQPPDPQAGSGEG